MKANLKQDLKMDLKAYQKHPQAPIFHRIKFDSTSVYLTKTIFYDLLYSENAHGCYRVFSWADPRAEALLGFELGDRSPKLGIAQLIGRFKPALDDLTDVQYETENGKAYFKSAKEELNEVDEKVSNPVKKIDSQSFLKFGEVIPTGSQGKAIYGKGNYIIDGAAGTGKSTTVLQKIKILQNKNINSDNICVIVKNKEVIKGFSCLLDSINIENLKIFTIDDFLFNYFEIIDVISYEDLSQINQYANNQWC